MRLTRRSLLAMAGTLPLAAQKSGNYLVYFGTYTRKASKGIYVSRFNARDGSLSEPELAAEIGNPSFVAIHPGGKNLYAVSELDGGGGAVTAFSIDSKSGKLAQLNRVSSKGGGPCHLNVDRTGKALIVVNYGTGSTAAIAVKADGSMVESASFVQHKGSSVNPQRQEGPHAHSVNISADNRFAVVADLGLDRVLVYKFDAANATIAPNDPPFTAVKAGSGPRHFTFHPKGRYAYVINEIACTVTAFQYDAAGGRLTEIETVSTLPAGVAVAKGYSTAEVRAHPGGKFLYGSNRGHNTIAVFQIDQKTGKLTLVENASTQGEIPRNFNLDPTGKWLLAANQNSDSVVEFSVDQASGKLTPSGKKLTVGTPVCIRFVAV